MGWNSHHPAKRIVWSPVMLSLMVVACSLSAQTCIIFTSKPTWEEVWMEDKYFYRKIVDEIPLPVYVFQDGDLTFFNQAFVEYTCYSRDELKGLNFLDLVHPSYRDTLVAQTRLALSGQQKNLPPEPELQVLRKTGETKWVRISPRIIEYNGQPAVLGVVADITGYKHS